MITVNALMVSFSMEELVSVQLILDLRDFLVMGKNPKNCENPLIQILIFQKALLLVALKSFYSQVPIRGA